MMEISNPEVVEEKPKFGGSKKGTVHNRLPTMLHDMRWAYRMVASTKKGTKNQEHFRQMYKDRPAEFITMLERLERQFKPVKKQQPKPGGDQQKSAPAARPAADLGEAKCVELVGRLLAEEGWKTPGAAPPGP